MNAESNDAAAATYKVCTGCGVEKSLTDFPKRRQMPNGRDGRSSHCRPCHVAMSMASYRKDKLGWMRRNAVTLYRKFRGDTEFWGMVEAADARGPRKNAIITMREPVA